MSHQEADRVQLAGRGGRTKQTVPGPTFWGLPAIFPPAVLARAVDRPFILPRPPHIEFSR
jgi:hypothetical protein